MSPNNSNAPNMIWIIIPMTHLSNKNYSPNSNTNSIANTKAKQILTEPLNLRYPVSKTIPTNSIKAKSNSSTITDYSKTQNKKSTSKPEIQNSVANYQMKIKELTNIGTIPKSHFLIQSPLSQSPKF